MLRTYDMNFTIFIGSVDYSRFHPSISYMICISLYFDGSSAQGHAAASPPHPVSHSSPGRVYHRSEFVAESALQIDTQPLQIGAGASTPHVSLRLTVFHDVIRT